MFDYLKKIIQYPRLTFTYPDQPMDNRLFASKPEIHSKVCTRCGICSTRCPSQAIALEKETGEIGILYDQCIFCMLCVEICPEKAIQISKEFEMAEKERKDLQKKTLIVKEDQLDPASHEKIEEELAAKTRKLFGRSLHIREVDAGSCNGCDYEINGLNNPFNDAERLGIHFVASPRHADMLLVTGTATRNMQQALLKTHQATPDPKLVVAVGACACSGGIFRDSYAVHNGIDSLVPVDVYVPGCPPRPQAILYGILKALDRVK